MKNVKNVVVKMPTGQNFLIETYDKKELMELLKKIEEVLKMTDEIMNGYLDSESAEKWYLIFLNLLMLSTTIQILSIMLIMI